MADPNHPSVRVPGDLRQVKPEATPVLRQGSSPEHEDSPETPASDQLHFSGNDIAAEVSDGPTERDDREQEKLLFMSQQHRRRQLLRSCERVLMIEFDVLSMPDWPDNFALLQARRRRDYWLMAASVCAGLFLLGMTDLVPAWLAGTGFGAFALLCLLALPPVRHVFSERLSYAELLLERYRILRRAREHVRHLEGVEGLAWQCAQLSEFNPVLRHSRFAGLLRLSESGALAGSLKTRGHMRLYLIFLLEAEKGYTRLQEAYLHGRDRALEEGWIETPTRRPVGREMEQPRTSNIEGASDTVVRNKDESSPSSGESGIAGEAS
ncbi:hypothetical protein [Mangrovitalea sediminis]|uniref:hypothetical protein n=1 Tax=Mangrovitalea sediminis TaxID=1982043 RepID=UPI000BE527D4|nr:hypothetical protein [Mangrovitalea sediminis]